MAVPTFLCFQNCSDGFSTATQDQQSAQGSEQPDPDGGDSGTASTGGDSTSGGSSSSGASSGGNAGAGTTSGGSAGGGGTTGVVIDPPPSSSGEVLLASVSYGGFRSVSKDSDFSLLSKIYDIPRSLMDITSPNCMNSEATVINGRCCLGSALNCYGSAGHSDFLYRDVAHGNGRFVAVGGWSHGIVSTSMDGTAWTQKIDLHSSTNLVSGINKSASWLSAIDFGNNQFVAASGAGYLYTSPDGLTWNSVSADSGPDSLREIHFTGNGFLVTGDSAFWGFSADGKTWTTSGKLPVTITDRTSHNMRTLANNQNFVLGMINSALGRTRVFKLNLNSITAGWTEVTSVPISVDAIVYVPEKLKFYVFTRNVSYSSTDGSVWTSEPTTLTVHPQQLAYDYGTFFTTSMDSANCHTVHRSKDGALWQSQKYCSDSAGNYGVRAIAVGAR